MGVQIVSSLKDTMQTATVTSETRLIVSESLGLRKVLAEGVSWPLHRTAENHRGIYSADFTVSGPVKIVRLITSVRAMCGPCGSPFGA